MTLSRATSQEFSSGCLNVSADQHRVVCGLTEKRGEMSMSRQCACWPHLGQVLLCGDYECQTFSSWTDVCNGDMSLWILPPSSHEGFCNVSFRIVPMSWVSQFLWAKAVPRDRRSFSPFARDVFAGLSLVPRYGWTASVCPRLHLLLLQQRRISQSDNT